MLNDPRTTSPTSRATRRPTRRASVLLLSTLALAAACGAPDRIAAPAVAAKPSAALLSPLLGGGGPVGRVLECTVDATAPLVADSAVIGPEGGTLAVGRTTVEIPAGAVAAPETFVLTVPTGTRVKVEVHAVGYDHYAFAAPVTVTVDITRCGDIASAQRPSLLGGLLGGLFGDPTPPALRSWYVEGDADTAVEDMGGVTDDAAHTHTFRTPHFSNYLLAE